MARAGRGSLRLSPSRAGQRRLESRTAALPKSVREIALESPRRSLPRYRAVAPMGKKPPNVVAASPVRWWRSCGPGREFAPTYGRAVLFLPLPGVGNGAQRELWLLDLVMAAGLAPDARPLNRGQPQDEETLGDNQQADESLITTVYLCSSSSSLSPRWPFPSSPEPHHPF